MKVYFWGALFSKIPGGGSCTRNILVKKRGEMALGARRTRNAVVLNSIFAQARS